MECKFCGMQFDGEICPICGTKAEVDTAAEKERERLAYERARQARERAQARNEQGETYNRYCNHCGAGVCDEAAVCAHCGRTLNSTDSATSSTSNLGINAQGMQSVIKILMIVGTVLMALETCGLGLIWCLPMYSHYNEKIKRGEKVSTTFKVCTLLFVNTIAGILMFLDGNI